MEYYRKAAAIFLLVITLLVPIYLEAEQKTAVADLEKIMEKSRLIQSLNKEYLDAEKGLSAGEQEELELKIRSIIESAAAELAEEADLNYESIIFKHPFYRGGEDITDKIIEVIDQMDAEEFSA